MALDVVMQPHQHPEAAMTPAFRYGPVIPHFFLFTSFSKRAAGCIRPRRLGL